MKKDKKNRNAIASGNSSDTVSSPAKTAYGQAPMQMDRMVNWNIN